MSNGQRKPTLQDLVIEKKKNGLGYISAKARVSGGTKRRLINLGFISDEDFKAWRRILGQQTRKKNNDPKFCLRDYYSAKCVCSVCKPLKNVTRK